MAPAAARLFIHIVEVMNQRAALAAGEIGMKSVAARAVREMIGQSQGSQAEAGSKSVSVALIVR